MSGLKVQMACFAAVASLNGTVGRQARKRMIATPVVRSAPAWPKKFNWGTFYFLTEPSKRERELEKEVERYEVLLAEAHADRKFLKKAQDYARRLKKQDTAVITGQNFKQFQKRRAM